MISTSARVHLVMIAALLATHFTSFHAIAGEITQASVAAPIALLKAGAAADRTSAAARCPNPYTVRKGDTLSRIAARCGVSTALLRQWNGLQSNAIWVGQSLITRASRRSPATPVPVPTPPIESPVSP